MKITIDPDGSVVIGEAFAGAYIETEEGNRMAFCLRDDTVEFHVLPKGGGSRWFRVDMQTLTVAPMEPATAKTCCEDGVVKWEEVIRGQRYLFRAACPVCVTEKSDG